MSARADQKAAARAARLAAEEGASASAARRRRLTVLGAVAAAAAIVVLAAVLLSRAGSEPAPTASERTALFAGVPQDGEWLGDPAAPVVLEEYVDLQCPFCAQFATGELPGIVRDYVRTGRVRLRLRLLTFLGPDSVDAARVAVAAGRQDRQWGFAEAFFSEQGQEGSGYATDAFLRERAAEVPGLDVDRAFADRQDPAVTRALEGASVAAQAAQVDSTPTFRVGSRGGELAPAEAENLRASLDAAVRRAGS